MDYYCSHRLALWNRDGLCDRRTWMSLGQKPTQVHFPTLQMHGQPKCTFQLFGCMDSDSSHGLVASGLGTVAGISRHLVDWCSSSKVACGVMQAVAGLLPDRSLPEGAL